MKWMKVRKKKRMFIKALKRAVRKSQPYINAAFKENEEAWNLLLTPQELAEKQGWKRYADN